MVGLAFRVVASLLPVGLLFVTKLIIDSIVYTVKSGQPVPHSLWWLVAAEFGLVIVNSVLTRTIDYLDSLFADKYTRHVSIEVLRHAAKLDLTTYEDPAFYDRLERARVQATDRLGMIQAVGRLVQQVITTLSLSISIVVFSPWLLVLLIVGVVPAFLGESHFAFLGYVTNFRQTPVKRQLDYLRVLGGSKEAAKELKLLNLNGFLIDRFTQLSDRIYAENVDLSRRRLRARDLAYGERRNQHWNAHVPFRRNHAGRVEHSADLLDGFRHRRPGAVPDGPDCVLPDRTYHPVQAERSSGSQAHHARL